MSGDFPGWPAGFRRDSLLAGYRLEAQVGAGGMAVVFRARDERLDRLVALKILTPALAGDEEFRTRFIAEAQAAAVVDDPFIIPVYDAGEAGGVLYIAMRFVQGGDLRHVLNREGALPPERAAGFISPVASALDAAHRAGLVHRDVKPGNILVDARGDRPDHVYLSDFGVAKAVSAAGLTGPGLFVGTPDYAAPEQIQARAVDGRADQYALACVAFQLLSGALPFRADQDLPSLLAHVSSPPPSLTALRPDLPRAVDQVIARAMAKDPGQRYLSCLEFASALRDALGLPAFDPEAAAATPAAPRPALAQRRLPDTVSLAAGAAPAAAGTRADPGTAVPAGGTAAGPRSGWARRHRTRALALAAAALAAIAGAAFAVTSLAQSPAPAAATSPAATSQARPVSSPDSTATAGFARVPVKLPSPYGQGGIGSLAFNPAGTDLAIAGGNRVCVWDIVTGKDCATSSAVSPTQAVAFSRDGRTLAVGGLLGHVALLAVGTMRLTAEVTDPGTNGVESLAFSPDDKTVAAGDDNGNTYLWDVATGRLAAALPDPHSGGVRTVAFSPDGRTLAAGDFNGGVSLWDTATGKRTASLADPGGQSANSVAFSPDGKTLAVGDFNGHVFLWDAASGKLSALVITDPGSKGVTAVAFSPDGRTLAVGDENNDTYLWDAGSGQLVVALPPPDGVAVTAVAFSPDGKTVATGHANGALNLWRIS